MTLDQLCKELRMATSPDPALDGFIHTVIERRRVCGEQANLEGDIPRRSDAPRYTGDMAVAQTVAVKDPAFIIDRTSAIGLCAARMEYEEIMRRSLIPIEEA